MFALSPDAPPALPFWIDGRAVLSLGERLVDVQNPRQEPVLRRVPVCDAAVAQRAVAAACAAQPAWAALDPALRQGVLAALATALAGYAPHFARLLGEDAGLTATAAAEDVARAEQALLALPAQAPLSPVCALLPAADDPAPGARKPTGVGHSIVASPLGEILLELGQDRELAIIDLDLGTVAAARAALPVAALRWHKSARCRRLPPGGRRPGGGCRA